ncbi:MAG TPA: tetratricopeptide repeat protein [Bacteroidia bacterium]|nr:tetratricopeptide repeat protein [Bacteroidia bacterium]
MRFRLLAFLLYFIPLLLAAQQAKLDSLHNVLRTTQSDTVRISALTDIAWRTWPRNADTAFQLLNEALLKCDKLKGHERSAWSGYTHNIFGNYYVMKGDAIKALNHFSISLTLYDSAIAQAPPARTAYYTHRRGVAIGNMGQAYELHGNYEKALDCYFASLKMWEEIGNKKAMAIKLQNIGIVYETQKDSVHALEYYTRSLDLFRAVNDSTNIARSLGNIGVLYFNQGNYRKALQYDSMALAIHEKKQNKRGMGVCLSNIGTVFEKLGDYTTALSCFERALALDIEVGNKRGQMIRLTNIGAIYTVQKKYAESEKILRRALLMADSMGNIAVAQEIHLNLCNLYKATGRYQLALEEFTTFTIIKDSLFNIERDRDLARKSAGYEYDRKADSTRAEQEKKDLADAAAKQLAEETLKTTRTTLYGFAIGFAIVLVLVFFVFRSYRAKKKANIEISLQKGIIEEKNKDILDSIHYAKRIQNALLASETLLNKHLPEYFVLFKPKDIVSGDFYYATEKNGKFYLAVCDSTGHGVPGAFMSLLNIAYLNEAVNEQKETSPDKIFNHVRNRLVENISVDGAQDGMDGVLVMFDRLVVGNSMKVNYVAAYNAPFVIRNNSGETLEADKMPVGKGEKTNDFSLHTATLETGSLLYLFTDGFADQFGGPRGKKMKRKALEEKLLSVHQLALEEQKTALENFLEEWKGGQEQVDDVLVIGIRV